MPVFSIFHSAATFCLLFGRSKSKKEKEYLRLPHILRVFATKEKTFATLFFPTCYCYEQSDLSACGHAQAGEASHHRQDAYDTLKKLRLLRFAHNDIFQHSFRDEQNDSKSIEGKEECLMLGCDPPLLCPNRYL